MNTINNDQEIDTIEITEEVTITDGDKAITDSLENDNPETNKQETDESEISVIEEVSIEEEISVEEDTTSQEPQYATENAAKSMQIVNLDSLIKRYLHDITKLKEQLREQKSMMEDSFENDAEYHEQNIKIQDANKVKNGIKQRIMKQPEVAVLVDKVNTLKEEVKDAQEMLFGYVEQYREISGMAQIVHDDGSIHEIIRQTKLIKKGKHRP